MMLSLMYVSSSVASFSMLKTTVVMIIIEWLIMTNSGTVTCSEWRCYTLFPLYMKIRWAVLTCSSQGNILNDDSIDTSAAMSTRLTSTDHRSISIIRWYCFAKSSPEHSDSSISGTQFPLSVFSFSINITNYWLLLKSYSPECLASTYTLGVWPYVSYVSVICMYHRYHM